MTVDTLEAIRLLMATCLRDRKDTGLFNRELIELVGVQLGVQSRARISELYSIRYSRLMAERAESEFLAMWDVENPRLARKFKGKL